MEIPIGRFEVRSAKPKINSLLRIRIFPYPGTQFTARPFLVAAGKIITGLPIGGKHDNFSITRARADGMHSTFLLRTANNLMRAIRQEQLSYYRRAIRA